MCCTGPSNTPTWPSDGKLYTQRTLPGRYWLPHPFVRDTVFCWLVWPEEDVSDAIFPIDPKRWS